MKHKTNLQQPQITKILKDLESRTLVKAIRPVNMPSKKFYMLFDLDASEEITGGNWYTNNEYDIEFVEMLRTQCLKFIKQEGDPTLDDIFAFVHEKGISRINLPEKAILQILTSLEFDGAIERFDGDEGDCFRQALLAIPEQSAFTSIPCGVCPVFNECTPDGPVSPATCVYYQQWLDF